MKIEKLIDSQDLLFSDNKSTGSHRLFCSITLDQTH